MHPDGSLDGTKDDSSNSSKWLPQGNVLIAHADCVARACTRRHSVNAFGGFLNVFCRKEEGSGHLKPNDHQHKLVQDGGLNVFPLKGKA